MNKIDTKTTTRTITNSKFHISTFPAANSKFLVSSTTFLEVKDPSVNDIKLRDKVAPYHFKCESCTDILYADYLSILYYYPCIDTVAI